MEEWWQGARTRRRIWGIRHHAKGGRVQGITGNRWRKILGKKKSYKRKQRREGKKTRRRFRVAKKGHSRGAGGKKIKVEEEANIDWRLKKLKTEKGGGGDLGSRLRRLAKSLSIEGNVTRGRAP